MYGVRTKRINGSLAVRRHNFSYKRKKPEYSIQRILKNRGFDNRIQKAQELALQCGINATTSALLCGLTAQSCAWGPADVVSFAKTLSTADVPYISEPAQMSVSLHIISLLCAK